MNNSIMGKGVADIVFMQQGSGDKDGEGREVARLVRTGGEGIEGTRWHEGTGGRLQMGSVITEAGKGGKDVDMEVFVIATVLLMLKKELDDLLNNQTALLT